jgi:hypothetical protein
MDERKIDAISDQPRNFFVPTTAGMYVLTTQSATWTPH